MLSLMHLILTFFLSSLTGNVSKYLSFSMLFIFLLQIYKYIYYLATRGKKYDICCPVTSITTGLLAVTTGSNKSGLKLPIAIAYPTTFIIIYLSCILVTLRTTKEFGGLHPKKITRMTVVYLILN